jgi:ERCC4-related helicase
MQHIEDRKVTMTNYDRCFEKMFLWISKKNIGEDDKVLGDLVRSLYDGLTRDEQKKIIDRLAKEMKQ